MKRHGRGKSVLTCCIKSGPRSDPWQGTLGIRMELERPYCPMLLCWSEASEQGISHACDTAVNRPTALPAPESAHGHVWYRIFDNDTKDCVSYTICIIVTVQPSSLNCGSKPQMWSCNWAEEGWKKNLTTVKDFWTWSKEKKINPNSNVLWI